MQGDSALDQAGLGDIELGSAKAGDRHRGLRLALCAAEQDFLLYRVGDASAGWLFESGATVFAPGRHR
jgi:hypothetical protein